jgi:predicted RND superfamily exporter protein
VTLTGLSVIGHDTEAIIHRDLPRLIGIAALAVAAYLLIHFRRVSSAALAVLPMVTSLLVLLAAARLVDQRLNLVNLIAVPLLIGVDVDYGIFLVSLAASRSGLNRRTLAERIDSGCYAVFVCAGSALLGFGSLYFTSVPAIQSLGFAVGVGISASLVFTLCLRLPLLFAVTPAEEAATARTETSRAD